MASNKSTMRPRTSSEPIPAKPKSTVECALFIEERLDMSRNKETQDQLMEEMKTWLPVASQQLQDAAKNHLEAVKDLEAFDETDDMAGERKKCMLKSFKMEELKKVVREIKDFHKRKREIVGP